jgi:hypothetical protein
MDGLQRDWPIASDALQFDQKAVMVCLGCACLGSGLFYPPLGLSLAARLRNAASLSRLP